ARALGTPVVSGNVSFYNETSGRAIFPTPTIAMVGLLEDWERHAVSHFTSPGLAVLLLGETREEVGGSEWLALRRGLEAGHPPVVDLEHERRLHALLAEGVAAGFIVTAHDVSDGGLAVALAECAIAGPERIGVDAVFADPLRPDALLFGESTGRIITASHDAGALLALARRHGIAAYEVGRTGGARLVIRPPDGGVWIDADVAELHAAWAGALPRRLATSGERR
ncbi:MAG: AIR synthase-related protein, partial [Myxococcota bacterium]|nr:AIR synthase-related protein [Myxococcota bacterium]